MAFLNMVRFSNISFFFCASSDIDKYSDMFTLISSKMIGQDFSVKDSELSFLLLKERYIFGNKIVRDISFVKSLMNIINGHFVLGCPK